MNGPATTEKTLSLSDLMQFTGSENCYRHAMNRSITYTDGVQYVAEHGGAYWLLDLIVLAQTYGAGVAAEEFQVWKLTVHAEKKTEPWFEAAVLVCEDGNGNVVYTRSIEFTDFPLPAVTLYFVNNTILLPSEY